MAIANLPAHPLPTHRKPGLEGSVNAERALGLPNAARAFQRSTRQSPYKVRLVIDQIRGLGVNEALAVLKFSKKHAADEIEKVLSSAVANAEDLARRDNRNVDVDRLYVAHAIVNEGPKLKRFTPAAMGRATPVHRAAPPSATATKRRSWVSRNDSVTRTKSPA